MVKLKHLLTSSIIISSLLLSNIILTPRALASSPYDFKASSSDQALNTPPIIIKFKKNPTQKNKKNIKKQDIETFISKHGIKSKNCEVKRIFTAKAPKNSIKKNNSKNLSPLEAQREARKAKARELFNQSNLGNIFEIKIQNGNDAIRVFSELQEEVKNGSAYIEYVEYSKKIYLDTVNDPLYNSTGEFWNLGYDELWSLDIIDADEAWPRSTGDGVVIAVVDSGIDYNHADLIDNIWVNTDVVTDNNNDSVINIYDLDANDNGIIEADEILDPDPNLFFDEAIGYNFVETNANPLDDDGHGTHVSGTAAAAGDNGKGVVGLAYQSKIMPIRVLGNGSGSDVAVADGVFYATLMGADIVNMSLGAEQFSKVLEDACNFALDLGVFIATAAGNDGKDGSGHFPAAFDSTISVAATTQTDARASFSNFGPSIDIAAPGGSNNTFDTSNITSSYPGYAVNFINPNNIIDYEDENSSAYARLGGTSMASPHVAALAALIKSQYPYLHPLAIKNIIQQTGDSITTDENIGKRINADAATDFFENPIDVHLILNKTEAGIQIFGTALGNNYQDFDLSIRGDATAGNWISLGDGSEELDNDLITTITSAPRGKYDIRLTVSDTRGYSFEAIRSVFGFNNAPSDISLEIFNGGIAEDAVAGDHVGDLTVTDLDSDDILLISSLFNTIFDFEATENYNIFKIILKDSINFEKYQAIVTVLSVTDEAHDEYSEAFLIPILDVEDQISISTCSELDSIRNDLHADYVLTNDIDCSMTVNWNGGTGFQPIADFNFVETNGLQFDGTLDGQGFGINDLYINRPNADNPQAIFGNVFDTVIKNLTINNANVTGSFSAAALIGDTAFEIPEDSEDFNQNILSSNIVRIENVQVLDSSITATLFAGGLIAYSTRWAGDSFRENFHFIDKSSVKADISAEAFLGGLTGVANNVDVNESFFEGDLFLTSDEITFTSMGGLFGYASNQFFATITNSYALADFHIYSNSTTIGGLIGNLRDTNHQGEDNFVENCYFAGEFIEQVSNETIPLDTEDTRIAGLVNSATDSSGAEALASFITNSFWDSELSGIDFSIGGSGKNTNEMQSESTFSDWDFTDTWLIDEGNAYPQLRSLIPPNEAPTNISLSKLDIQENSEVGTKVADITVDDSDSNEHELVLSGTHQSFFEVWLKIQKNGH